MLVSINARLEGLRWGGGGGLGRTLKKHKLTDVTGHASTEPPPREHFIQCHPLSVVDGVSLR